MKQLTGTAFLRVSGWEPNVFPVVIPGMKVVTTLSLNRMKFGAILVEY
jgi:hypothetical protein